MFFSGGSMDSWYMFWIMGIVFYFVMTYLNSKWNKEWLRDCNKKYKKNIWYGLHFWFLIIAILLGFFFLYVDYTVYEQTICVQEINEWEEQRGNFLAHKTIFRAKINNQYVIWLDYPNQFKKGDCFRLRTDILGEQEVLK